MNNELIDESVSEDCSSLSQDLSEDEYMQRKAIPLDEMQMEGEQQIQAFRYLMGVRQQATLIKEKTKIIQKQNRKKHLFKKKAQIEEIQQKKWQNSWFDKWTKQVIENWKCVIANVVFLRKRSGQSCKIKIDINQKPEIHRIAVLPIGKIQTILEEISNIKFSQGGKYYYLWIYALLAIHQAQSPYLVFQSLASISACICQEKKNTKNGNYLQCLTVCVILDLYFHQNHLRSKIQQLLEECLQKI